MREIDLTSTYLQVIGYVRDGAIVCSSMTGAPVPLGTPSFHTRDDVGFYLDVPIRTTYGHPLLAMERSSYAVLIHRNLPLDIWTDAPDMSLAIMQLDRRRASIQNGHVGPAWLARLGAQPAVTFVEGAWLVAIGRSQHFQTAAVAATPVGHMEQRYRDMARRLVPAGVFAGLAAASSSSNTSR